MLDNQQHLSLDDSKLVRHGNLKAIDHRVQFLTEGFFVFLDFLLQFPNLFVLGPDVCVLPLEVCSLLYG